MSASSPPIPPLSATTIWLLCKRYNITIPGGDYGLCLPPVTNLVTAAGLSNFTLTYSSLTKSYTFNDDSVIDVSFNDELGYDLGFGATQNLNIGSVQFPVSAIASYEVTSSNNTFTVAVNSGSEVTYTIATGTQPARSPLPWTPQCRVYQPDCRIPQWW